EDGLLRPLIIKLMCDSHDPEATSHALGLFKQANQPNSVAGSLRSTIFATAAEQRGAVEFERLLNWHKTTTSAEERVDLAAGLSATIQPELAKIALGLLTSKSVKKQDVHFWFKSLMRNPHTRVETWQWLQTNWEWVKHNFSSDFGYTKFPSSSAAAFSTPEHLGIYKKFFTPLLDEPALTRNIRQGLEEIESRMLWRQRDLDDVAGYLK
ncbi:MAG TPA: ERAP1-like C-terminal domain-containing protein, partial [Patescibacteria group bacterium]|nr:ERAP1-like C-terminal domain-containing protein [Patescibacteria group bacterium]